MADSTNTSKTWEVVWAGGLRADAKVTADADTPYIADERLQADSTVSHELGIDFTEYHRIKPSK